MKITKNCEMVFKNRCLGCQGLSEADWLGKEYCGTYKELKYGNKDTIISKTKEK